jgi:hypothetical protein
LNTSSVTLLAPRSPRASPKSIHQRCWKGRLQESVPPSSSRLEGPTLPVRRTRLETTWCHGFAPCSAYSVTTTCG